jgi:serine/threonine protein kinase
LARTPLQKDDPSRVGGYRLTARLGAGGMGVVYLGTAKDGSQVAIKMLRPELADDTEFRVRFRREAATLEKVRGLCTVRVIEADSESPRPFLVTEYADGPSLAEWVNGHGPFGAEMLYGLATGLAEALAAIHAAGVVHRDLKPSNVLLAATGPKVIDFGIAQALDATVLTRTGMTVGSPGFMAPEQILGQAGQPADVFAWGVTVAYAATGQFPFGAGPADALLYRVLHELPDLAGVVPEIRPLVEAALAKQPGQRPSAPDLLRRLAAGAASGEDPAFMPTQTVLARTWLPAAAELSLAVSKPSRPSRRRLPVLLSVAVAAAMTGIGLAFLAHPAAKPGDATGSTKLPSARPPAASQSTSVSSVSASPRRSATSSAVSTSQALGGIAAGTQNCAYNSNDGTYLASVQVTHSTCRDVASALAKGGQYWWPVSYQTPGEAAKDGSGQACALTGDGMTMTVYDFTSNAPTQTVGGVANSVCQKEEAAGWLPS